MNLTLPYPPSLNHYWRNVRGRVLISRQGREYRHIVIERTRSQIPDSANDEIMYPVGTRLAVRLHICPPDRRRRDLDNAQKALLDSLTHAGVYADDSQIDFLVTSRGPVVPGGQVLVSIERLEDVHAAVFADTRWIRKPDCTTRSAPPAAKAATETTDREVELPAIPCEPRRGSILRAGGGLITA